MSTLLKLHMYLELIIKIIFFPIFLFLYIAHYLICVFFLILVLYCIPTVLFLCMSVLCLHYVNKKWSDKDIDCTCCVYCILQLFT